MKIIFFYVKGGHAGLEEHGLTVSFREKKTAFLLLPSACSKERLRDSIRQFKETGNENLFIVFEDRKLYMDAFQEMRDGSRKRRFGIWRFLNESDHVYLMIVPELIGLRQKGFDLNGFLDRKFLRESDASFFHALAFSVDEIKDVLLGDDSDGSLKFGINVRHVLDSYEWLYGNVEKAVLEKVTIAMDGENLLKLDIFSGVSVIKELFIYSPGFPTDDVMDFLSRKLSLSGTVLYKCVVFTDSDNHVILDGFLRKAEGNWKISYRHEDRIRNAESYYYDLLPKGYSPLNVTMKMENEGMHVHVTNEYVTYVDMHPSGGMQTVADCPSNYRCLASILLKDDADFCKK